MFFNFSSAGYEFKFTSPSYRDTAYCTSVHGWREVVHKGSVESVPRQFSAESVRADMKRIEEDRAEKERSEDVLRRKKVALDLHAGIQSAIWENRREYKNNRGYMVDHQILMAPWLKDAWCLTKTLDDNMDIVLGVEKNERCEKLSGYYKRLIDEVVQTEFVTLRGFAYKNGVIWW